MFELLHRPTPNTTHSIDGHIALRVDNVYEALEALAIKVCRRSRARQASRNGVGRIGIIRDPDGVKIELVDRADLRDL